MKLLFTQYESQVLEVLVNSKGELMSLEQISEIINNKYYNTGMNSTKATANSLRLHIANINKKTNNLIKNKRKSGYYIEKIKEDKNV